MMQQQFIHDNIINEIEGIRALIHDPSTQQMAMGLLQGPDSPSYL